MSVIEIVAAVVLCFSLYGFLIFMCYQQKKLVDKEIKFRSDLIWLLTKICNNIDP